MGEVYLAVDPRIQQQVAVKVLQAETSIYPTSNVANEAERFRREASAIANLRHRNIVPLYDYNKASIDQTSLTYLVIPYYKDGSFANWLRQRGSNLLPMDDVAYFVQQAAAALQYAHERHIIHRDVKPTNFLIDSSENPNRPNLLLTDFGISKFGMTGTAGTQSVGTLTYEPPEQLQGHPTYASDQYALAIMAYELLVGRPPFEGSPSVVIRAHMEEQPRPPSLLNPRLPRSVDHVLLRALDKKPENRYASIAEFARALQQALPKTGEIPQQQADSRSREPHRGRDIRETLRISPAEAQRGTRRIVALPGGRQMSVTVPANAYNGLVLTFPGLGEPSPGGSAGNLIVILSITSPDVPPLPQVSRPEPQGGKKSRTAVIAVSAVLIGLVVLVGIFAVLRSALNPGPGVSATETAQANATSLAQGNNAAATASAQAQTTRNVSLTATALVTSHYPPFTNLAYNDPLTSSSDAQWAASSACKPSSNGYQASVAQAGTFQRCKQLLNNYPRTIATLLFK
jgi:serine/threonine protein kinase